MKIKITESQYKRLVEDVESPMDSLDKYKPVCFKYWDRFGPGITNKMVNVLGIKNTLTVLNIVRFYING